MGLDNYFFQKVILEFRTFISKVPAFICKDDVTQIFASTIYHVSVFVIASYAGLGDWGPRIPAFF